MERVPVEVQAPDQEAVPVQEAARLHRELVKRSLSDLQELVRRFNSPLRLERLLLLLLLTLLNCLALKR